MNLLMHIQPSLRDSADVVAILDPGTEVPSYSQSPLRGSIHKADKLRAPLPNLSRTYSQRVVRLWMHGSVTESAGPASRRDRLRIARRFIAGKPRNGRRTSPVGTTEAPRTHSAVPTGLNGLNRPSSIRH